MNELEMKRFIENHIESITKEILQPYLKDIAFVHEEAKYIHQQTDLKLKKIERSQKKIRSELLDIRILINDYSDKIAGAVQECMNQTSKWCTDVGQQIIEHNKTQEEIEEYVLRHSNEKLEEVTKKIKRIDNKQEELEAHISRARESVTSHVAYNMQDWVNDCTRRILNNHPSIDLFADALGKRMNSLEDRINTFTREVRE